MSYSLNLPTLTLHCTMKMWNALPAWVFHLCFNTGSFKSSIARPTNRDRMVCVLSLTIRCEGGAKCRAFIKEMFMNGKLRVLLIFLYIIIQFEYKYAYITTFYIQKIKVYVSKE